MEDLIEIRFLVDLLSLLVVGKFDYNALSDCGILIVGRFDYNALPGYCILTVGKFDCKALSGYFILIVVGKLDGKALPGILDKFFGRKSKFEADGTSHEQHDLEPDQSKAYLMDHV
ncbi:MAG: hypothetical protein EZS28_003656 [Streblomastix strix]|uniref:Uncharacterized protein n=1 Tax=Streblomastix strix TaxID=222440 RepID=A0A5J4X2D5_9EUKA|nr:MAG: hypothetical protein EZS28_003656 [Streblomastix strix]